MLVRAIFRRHVVVVCGNRLGVGQRRDLPAPIPARKMEVDESDRTGPAIRHCHVVTALSKYLSPVTLPGGNTWTMARTSPARIPCRRSC